MCERVQLVIAEEGERVNRGTFDADGEFVPDEREFEDIPPASPYVDLGVPAGPLDLRAPDPEPGQDIWVKFQIGADEWGEPIRLQWEEVDGVLTGSTLPQPTTVHAELKDPRLDRLRAYAEGLVGSSFTVHDEMGRTLLAVLNGEPIPQTDRLAALYRQLNAAEENARIWEREAKSQEAQYWRLRKERDSYREGIDCALRLLNNRFEEGNTAQRVDEAHEALALAVEHYLDEEPEVTIEEVGTSGQAGLGALRDLKRAAMRCRPEVLAFACVMERKLRLNDHKGGWTKDHPRSLITRIIEETRELERVAVGAWARSSAASSLEVVDEAADVGNFAMMVADRLGCLAIYAAALTDGEGRGVPGRLQGVPRGPRRRGSGGRG